MRRVLINFAHPAKARSNVNARLRKAVEHLDDVTINDLYTHYPDFLIDVEREQYLCETHDIIVFQHPFYWYSTPSIMKEWMDLVLEYGWAYGSGGRALQGKGFFQAISAGGDSESYQQNGYNKFTLKELTSPYQATANLCGMQWLPPFAITGVHKGISNEQLNQYAEDYRRVILAFRDERLNIEAAKKVEYLNKNLDHIIEAL